MQVKASTHNAPYGTRYQVDKKSYYKNVFWKMTKPFCDMVEQKYVCNPFNPNKYLSMKHRCNGHKVYEIDSFSVNAYVPKSFKSRILSITNFNFEKSIDD